MNKVIVFLSVLLMCPSLASAQIGDHRNEFAIGVNGGYVMSNVGFTPSVTQTMHGGLTGGMTFRYTCEKYFKSICAIVGEVNIAQMGWKEDIRTAEDLPVINSVTGVAEEYERQLTYVQVPLMARLGWGRERKGFQAFFQLGPQFGMYLSDKSKSNFDFDSRNVSDRVGALRDAVMDTLGIQHKFDYGITAGFGLEYSRPRLGHFMIEARYYYGLGDIYGNTKSDYFGRSNNSGIFIKLTYLWDVIKSKNNNIK